MGNLTGAFVRSVTKAGRYGDGDTLFLRVTPSGSRSWIQRLTIEGQRHDIGLGPFPVIGLAEARERAFANRVAVAHGGKPACREAPGQVADLPRGGRTDVRGDQGTLAECENREDVAEHPGKTGISRLRGSARGHRHARRCAPRCRADLVHQAGNRAEASRVHPGDAVMVPSSRVHRRRQRGWGEHRRRPAVHAGCQAASSRRVHDNIVVS